MNNEAKYRLHLSSIFDSALSRVDPYEMIRDCVSLSAETLTVKSEGQVFSENLCDFDRILIVGAGKASATMARAVEDLLGPRISGGLVVVKYGHADNLSRVELVEAGHPVPDGNGVEAARRILELVSSADSRTLVIVLISGGGSALLAAPYHEGQHRLTLDDLVATNQALLAGGAPIQHVNCVRKHISAVKGGRFAQALYPAASISLILSDVVGDRLDSIASGPTVADPTTYAQSLSLLKHYGITDRLPPRVIALLEAGRAGRAAETPKPGDAVFDRCRNSLVGSNVAAVRAAAARAAELGYAVQLLGSQLTGEAREIAKIYSGMAKDQVTRRFFGDNPLCVIGGGETTVTIRGDGLGGRCQELALSFLLETAGGPTADGAYFLSASTDGSDGPTDAAGAVVIPSVVRRAVDRDGADYLSRNDSYHFFEGIGGLYKTGPTRTNVCDIQVLIVQ